MGVIDDRVLESPGDAGMSRYFLSDALIIIMTRLTTALNPEGPALHFLNLYDLPNRRRNNNSVDIPMQNHEMILLAGSVVYAIPPDDAYIYKLARAPPLCQTLVSGPTMLQKINSDP